MPDEQQQYQFVREGKTVTLSIPRQINLVPSAQSSAIIGRDREVREVREKLRAGTPVMLVNGIGGIGKTTVALKYLAEYETLYKHIAWLTLSSSLPESFVNDGELVRRFALGPTLVALPPEQLYAAGCKAILDAINTLDDCLLILDNANELDQLLEWQNALHACRAHVLITSRSQPQGWPSVAVETLPPAQARDLFRKYYQFQQPDDNALDALLHELGHHTLLTELSAKAAQASRMPFEQLLKAVQDNYIQDEALNLRAVDTGQSGQSLAERRKIARVEAYVDLIFSEISNLFDGEKEQLKPFTLLPPAEWYEEAELANVFQQLKLELQPNVLDRLVEKGWLLRENEPTKTIAYKIHPLIQEVAVKHLDISAEWAAPVIQAIAESIDYDNIDPEHDLFEKAKDKPWADYLEKRFRGACTVQFSYLLDRIACIEKNFGQYKRAAQLGEKALEIDLELFGSEHPKVANRQSNLGDVYRNLGAYEKARDLLEVALASDLENFGPEHPEVAISQSNLAIVYSNLSQNEKSRDLLETALTSDLKRFGPEHPKVAILQSNLAIAYSNLGQYENARDLLETALASDLKNFGPEHPKVAIRQSNLALVYKSLRLYEKATDLLEAAIASDLKNFGPEHPEVATSYNNLALVFAAIGNTSEALKHFEKALVILRHNFGNQHPYIDIVLKSIASQQGD